MPALFERTRRAAKVCSTTGCKGQFIVVDEVPDTLVMRLGKKTAVLINRHPSKDQAVRIAER